MRRRGFGLFQFVKTLQSFFLELSFTFIVRNDSIEVKGDSQRRAGIFISHRSRQNQTCGLMCCNRSADAVGISTQKKRDIEGFKKWKG